VVQWSAHLHVHAACIFMCMLHAWLWFCRSTLHVLTQAHKIVYFVLKRRGIAWLILCLTLPSFVIWWHKWIYCTQQSSFLNRSIQFRQIIQNRGKWWIFQSVSSFIFTSFAYQEKGVLSTWHDRSLTVIPISSCLTSWLSLGSCSCGRWKSSSWSWNSSSSSSSREGLS
jgi:hypothetical protein